MQFLKTLFWVLLAVFIALFASRNWFDVTLNLWGDLQADIKVPLLLAMLFLLGFLPTFLIYRAKLWAIRRRTEANDAQPAVPIEPAAREPEDVPVI
jgi:uncharacterized integral membrane protein